MLVIEYEIISWADLDGMGDLAVRLKEAMGRAPQVGIIRCASKDGHKVTFASCAKATKELVKSGAASNPDGIAIPENVFPVMLAGWPYRLRRD
jgi:hypothetical protein